MAQLQATRAPAGIFTKVVQRIPVKIAVEQNPESVPLRPGMSVQVSIETGRVKQRNVAQEN
jgi:multidrug resistance efflux pump